MNDQQYRNKYINFNRNVIKKHNPKNHKQALYKKYKPNIFNINQDGRNEAVNINVTEPPVGTLTGSQPLPPKFLTPQILINFATMRKRNLIVVIIE
ncbi:hypothetical protein C2G38_2199900 [Gigaspora rosea]|uniref:Uncharacterized protein n=1 Tax=Gigaspora rosea TaxID=44941 RepID=A0A397UR64_9GLOM|nr:hypothetical protein C2G38_2199900 [Gigaspora rosea]